jgi:protein-tyrosine phosphatase
VRAVNILTLCTGNVARSVMLGYMLTTLAESTGEEWHVRTAGTHVAEGAPMSSRTRDALLGIDELGDHHYGAHRSHQLDDDDVRWADLILSAEADQVRYVRATYPEGSTKTVQLHQFVRFAPLDDSIALQIMQVAAMEPSSEFDVTDPAGGDQTVYDECAQRLWELAQVFSLLMESN